MRENEKEQKKIGIKYLFNLADQRNKSKLYIAILLSVLSGLVTFVPYLALYNAIIIAFSNSINTLEIVKNGIMALIAIVCRIVLQSLAIGVTHVAAYNVLYDVRKKLCNHIGRVNLGFFTENATGEIKKVLMEDVEKLEAFLAHQIPDLTVAIVIPIIVLFYLFSKSIPMSLFLFIPILLTFIIMSIQMTIAKPIMEKIPTILGNLNSGIMQFVNGMPVMKAYNLTTESYKNYQKAIDDYCDLWCKSAKVLAPISMIFKVLIESGILFTLPFGGYLYLKGNLELNNYIFFIIMGIVFLSSFNNVLNFAQIFSQISSGIERVKKVIDIEMIKSGNKVLSKENIFDLEFKNVSFGYSENRKVLNDINIKLPAGTLTAFVGASGAGKTTAAQLIPRFWDTFTGNILIDGKDIRDVSLEELMNNLSFVFQEAFMLNESIYQNIAIGKPNCSKEDVYNAAKSAQIHDFIMSLPDQYNTKLGEGGVKLSGGEKQRICIARAILKDAPIIIFDEATSFTDGENEHKIQIALEKLLKGKTTIMIAHRLHTIKNADQICVFNEGKIVEHGSHDHLIEKNGYYEKLWNKYIS